MGYNLIFSNNREVFNIEISNHIVTYKDRKLKDKVQFMPKDPKIHQLVLMSRNRIPHYILDLIEDANRGHNLEEYQAAKTDEELIPIVIRDCKIKGCLHHKTEEITNEPTG